MIMQIADNPLCWVMLLTAWFTYQSIFSMVAQDKVSSNPSTQAQSASHADALANVLVGALPLMGLLGTISGLQLSFTGMMSGGVDSQLVTQGIAGALFTTQLGLVLAIPGWLMMVCAKYVSKRNAVTVLREVASE